MSGDFSAYLAPGEQIRWSGRPAQGLALRASDFFLIPFSLVWFGFVVFWMVTAFASNAPTGVLPIGILFLFVGFYISFGRFLSDAWARSRTYYALTDRRALILGGAFERKLTSVELNALSELHFNPGSSGRGTIVFGPESPYGGSFGGWGRRYAAASPEFFRVDDASGAYAIIQRRRQQQ